MEQGVWPLILLQQRGPPFPEGRSNLCAVTPCARSLSWWVSFVCFLLFNARFLALNHGLEEQGSYCPFSNTCWLLSIRGTSRAPGPEGLPGVETCGAVDPSPHLRPILRRALPRTAAISGLLTRWACMLVPRPSCERAACPRVLGKVVSALQIRVLFV